MAGYYPIKCPYCLRTHTNESVYYNLKDAVTLSSRAAPKAAYTEPEQTEWSAGNSDWDSDPPGTQTSAGYGESTKLPTDGHYTLQQLRDIFGEQNVKLTTKQVLALPALTSEEYSGDLVVGVTLTVTEGDREIEKAMYDRYCDCDGYRKQRMSAGSVPSYVILLLGSSNAGKTMYLLALYHTLSRRGGYALPPTGDAKNCIARLSMNVLSDSQSADTDIAKMTDELFLEGNLPKTTVSITNEPLALDITVDFTRSGLKKKALLYLRDMPGETITNRDKQNELLRIANQFPKFDAFMTMLDPTTFRESVFPSAGREEAQRQRTQLNRLSEVIVERITPIMPGNTITQPTAAIITKGDLFFDARYVSELRSKGLTYAMPPLASAQQESFDKNYFDEIHLGARTILQKLSDNIIGQIGVHFGNMFYSVASALSKTPIEIAEERVKTPNAINPWRVTDPMLRLLMRLNILPPFDETNVRRRVGESEEERAARVFRNKAAVNDWGAKYCSGASDQTLV
jgi:GTPase SAR1 family protein